jgi:hypothetical protein
MKQLYVFLQKTNKKASHFKQPSCQTLPFTHSANASYISAFYIINFNVTKKMTA